ncbi:MAG: MFS transporter [Thermoplasmatota archaeon]
MLPAAARDFQERVRGTLSGGRYVRLLSGVYLAMFLIRVAFGIVIVTFSRYVTANDFLYGLVAASEPLLELIAVFFVGLAVDRFGRKGILLGGLGLGAVVLFGFALVPPRLLVVLALLNGVHGIASAAILVTTLAIIASYAPREHRGREMGLFNFANMFGYIAGAAAGSVMLATFTDLRFSFVVAGSLAALGLAYAFFAVVDPKGARGSEESGASHHEVPKLSAVLANPRLVVLSLSWFMVFIFIGTVVAYFGRATTAAGSRTAGGTVAIALIVFGGVFVLSQTVFGRLADRWGRARAMLLGAFGFLGLMAAILVGALVGPRTNDGIVAFIVAWWPLLLLFTVASLAFAPAGLAALADEAKAGREGATMSLWSVTLNLGFIVGPPIVGAVSTTSGAFGVVIFFFALSLLIVASVVWRMI